MWGSYTNAINMPLAKRHSQGWGRNPHSIFIINMILLHTSNSRHGTHVWIARRSNICRPQWDSIHRPLGYQPCVTTTSPWRTDYVCDIEIETINIEHHKHKTTLVLLAILLHIKIVKLMSMIYIYISILKFHSLVCMIQSMICLWHGRHKYII